MTRTDRIASPSLPYSERRFLDRPSRHLSSGAVVAGVILATSLTRQSWSNDAGR